MPTQSLPELGRAWKDVASVRRLRDVLEDGRSPILGIEAVDLEWGLRASTTRGTRM